MRGSSPRIAIALLLASGSAFAACSSDLFHDTDWPTECKLHPGARGCEASASSTGVGGSGNGGATTIGGGGGQGGSGGAACSGKEKRCGSKCIDEKTDPKNCGGCGRQCIAGQTCIDGSCAYATSCRQLLADHPSTPSGKYTIDPDGDADGGVAPFDVYCDMKTKSGGYTLVLKLSAGDFCYGSTRWDDDVPFNEARMVDATVPAVNEFDAKSAAFYTLRDTTELLFVTTTGSVSTTFASASSPKILMTTQTVPFAPYPDRAAWVAAFGHDRNQAPIFMRGGAAETNGNTCRTNPAMTPSGCGQPCVFCYQAADGDCCGCDATVNDTNSGVGNNVTYCGGGLANCSTAGTWSNPNEVTLVYAR